MIHQTIPNNTQIQPVLTIKETKEILEKIHITEEVHPMKVSMKPKSENITKMIKVLH